MTPTEETVEQVYGKSNDIYIANTGGLRKFYSMSSSNSMIVLCKVRYLNTSRNLNHNVVKRQYRPSAHQYWDSVLGSVVCTNLEDERYFVLSCRGNMAFACVCLALHEMCVS